MAALMKQLQFAVYFKGVGVGGSPAFSRIESIKILRRGRCVELALLPASVGKATRQNTTV